jgi:ferrochelatase
MKRNLLLVNLGSPEAPTPRAVGRYLNEFLMDPFVIDVPAPLRWLLVRVLIVPKRKYTSAEAYRKIWRPEGSPLLVNSQQFLESVKREKPNWDFRLAMRYGRPSLKEVLGAWLRETREPIDIVPLYPQYAKSSTGTCWNEVYQLGRDTGSLERMRILVDFYEAPAMISSFAENWRAANKDFNADYTLFSFHGLPEHHITELDVKNRRCYRTQCFQTAGAIAGDLRLSPHDFSISFQSRLGRRPWIKPYTDVVLKELAESGKRRLLVACPSFVSDCLETLEEIQLRARSDFIRFGGEDLRLVPSLNAAAHWVKDFCGFLEDNEVNWEPVKSWEQPSTSKN